MAVIHCHFIDMRQIHKCLQGALLLITNVTTISIYLIVIFMANTAMAEEYLDAAELGTIGTVSAGIEWLGTRVSRVGKNRRPIIRGHLPLEEKFQRWLGGDCKLGSRNFLDGRTGAIATAVGSGLLLTVNNLAYPRDEKGKDAAQDLFLMISGAFATRGLTNITKGIFARERPFVCIYGDSAKDVSSSSHTYRYNSFFSGHASGAFFAAGYLNLRVRHTMLREMSPGDYRGWRWASSGITIGWASFVALSRVHAYKHHLSDVIVGSAAGILMAELFFSFNNTNKTPIQGPSGAPILFRVTFPI